MRLDPKYFNTFLAVVAVIAALVIIFFTINTQQNKRAAFKDRIMKQDSLQTVRWTQVTTSDSLRISDFDSSFVLLQFWSNWSDTSIEEQQTIAAMKQQLGEQLAVISAIVGLRKEEAITYVQEHDFPFNYVAGSRQFSSFQVPGLPAYVLFKPGGEIGFVSLGTLQQQKVDSLKKVIRRGRN
jgi:thiol-disulfide isomerase/thioredoxin